jgi:hypothetical protein
MHPYVEICPIGVVVHAFAASHGIHPAIMRIVILHVPRSVVLHLARDVAGIGRNCVSDVAQAGSHCGDLYPL